MPKSLRSLVFGLLALVLFLSALAGPSRTFPAGQVFSIEDGSSVTEVAAALEAQKFIRSPFLFRLALAFESGPSLVVAGDYFFDRPINVFRLAVRLGRGDYGLESVKVTLPEGATAREMGLILSRALPAFTAAAFTAAAEEFEGYLFPDTYFFPSIIKPEKIIARLRINFQNKIKPLAPAVAASGRTLEQIVIMASLIEEEARLDEARRTIAGILWKRLDQGMPLQVDAVFPYINGKNTFELDRADLATSSLYNTYRYRGLPVGPITNPGLDAIGAALNPIETDYWYYLSDRAGNLHYAVDFDQHKRNKAKYLTSF